MYRQNTASTGASTTVVGKFTCNFCQEIFRYLTDNVHECRNCYEVKNRLEDFLRSENGRQFVKRLLLKAEGRVALNESLRHSEDE